MLEVHFETLKALINFHIFHRGFCVPYLTFINLIPNASVSLSEIYKWKRKAISCPEF